MQKKSLGRILAGCLTVALTLALCFSLAACTPKSAVYLEVKDGDKVTKVVVDLSKFSEKDTVLTVLKSKSVSKKLNPQFDETGFMTGILTLKYDAEKHESVIVYVSDKTFSDNGSKTTTLNDVTYYSSNKGIGDLPLNNGLRVLFILETW